jgi:hypothetical protein
MPQAVYSRNNPTAVEVVNDSASPVSVDASGTVVTVIDKRAATSTVTAIPAAVSNTQIVAASASRLGVMIYNDSTAAMYLRYGSGTPSASDYSTQLQPGALLIVPDRSSRLEMRAIWAAANGNARVTEVS